MYIGVNLVNVFIQTIIDSKGGLFTLKYTNLVSFLSRLLKKLESAIKFS